ncbi:MAG TPA: sulfite exporter TauE/SafE family protein [Rhodoferax sp.]
MIDFALVFVSLNIGILVGAVGVGGILLPPALTMIVGVSLHQSMATSLFTFIFTGIVGTIYFHRKGSIDWALVKPVCSSAAVAGFLGGWTNAYLSTTTLSLTLSVIIILAGAYTSKADQRKQDILFEHHPQRQMLLLAGIGALAGFASGLAGVGGPVLSVPLMVMCGFPIMRAIGVSQVLQVVSAVSGTAANLQFGTIDFGLASFITVFEVSGVLLGAYLIHRMDTQLVKKFVGILCLAIGIIFLFRTPINQ